MIKTITRAKFRLDFIKACINLLKSQVKISDICIYLVYVSYFLSRFCDWISENQNQLILSKFKTIFRSQVSGRFTSSFLTNFILDWIANFNFGSEKRYSCEKLRFKHSFQDFASKCISSKCLIKKRYSSKIFQRDTFLAKHSLLASPGFFKECNLRKNLARLYQKMQGKGIVLEDLFSTRDLKPWSCLIVKMINCFNNIIVVSEHFPIYMD